MKDRRILVLFLIVLTNQIGAGALLPVLSLYVEGAMGATAVQAMLVVAAFYGAQFLCAPWLGRLSDRWGRRPVLVVSQLGTVLAYVVMAGALPLGAGLDGWGLPIGLGGSLWVMFAARLLDGATGGNISVAQAYVSDISPPAQRTQQLGLIGGATGLGYVFGPVFGGGLGWLGLPMPFVGAAVITGVTLLLTLFWLAEPEQKVVVGQAGRGGAAVWWQNPTRLLIIAIAFVTVMAFSALQNIFPLYGVHTLFAERAGGLSPILKVGLMLTFIALVIAVTQLGLIKPLAARYGERRLVIGGSSLLVVGSLVIWFSSVPLWVLVGFVPFGVGYSVSLTSLQGLLARTGEGVQGQLMGWFQSAVSLGYLAGLGWVGVAFVQWGPASPFLVAAGLFGVAWGLGVWLPLVREVAGGDTAFQQL